MFGATTARVPTSVRRPLNLIPSQRGNRFDPSYWIVAAYGRKQPACQYPYTGAYPYCILGARVWGGTSGLGLLSPTIAPSFRQGYDIVGTGPRRPPPPPLRLFGLGAMQWSDFTPTQKTGFVAAMLGSVLVGVSLGYYAWGR